MMIETREATRDDVEACVRLIEARRVRYAEFEPRLWRKAANSAQMSTTWFTHLFAQPEVASLVAVEDERIVGFIIGANFPPPPVVSLDGKNALIDDFAVEEDDRWADIGLALLEACKARLKELGFVQVVVVGADKDTAKSAFLKDRKLSLASTWWASTL